MLLNINTKTGLLAMFPFRVPDNPYKDIAEGYYIFNTNVSNTQQDHNDMLPHGKAAAYFADALRNMDEVGKLVVLGLKARTNEFEGLSAGCLKR